jgi:hypothetical protein
LISHRQTSFSSDGSKASSLLDRSARSMDFWSRRRNSEHSCTWHNRGFSRNWIERLEQVINTNGDYVWWPT